MERLLRLAAVVCVVAVTLLLLGCPLDGPTDQPPSNQPPEPVTAGWKAAGPGTTSGTVTQAPSYVYSNTTYYYQLQVPGDPDGDAVAIKSSVLPAWLALDGATGLVTIAGLTPRGTTAAVDFWSEDALGAGTSASPYQVTFTIVGG